MAEEVAIHGVQTAKEALQQVRQKARRLADKIPKLPSFPDLDDYLAGAFSPHLQTSSKQGTGKDHIDSQLSSSISTVQSAAVEHGPEVETRSFPIDMDSILTSFENNDHPGSGQELPISTSRNVLERQLSSFPKDPAQISAEFPASPEFSFPAVTPVQGSEGAINSQTTGPAEKQIAEDVSPISGPSPSATEQGAALIIQVNRVYGILVVINEWGRVRC